MAAAQAGRRLGGSCAPVAAVRQSGPSDRNRDTASVPRRDGHSGSAYPLLKRYHLPELPLHTQGNEVDVVKTTVAALVEVERLSDLLDTLPLEPPGQSLPNLERATKAPCEARLVARRRE